MIDNNDLRFPIKYAVLELKSPGGYSTNYEDVTEGFIVSKCYVLESNVKYYPNGCAVRAVESYKVFFPYDDIEGFKRMTFMGIPYYEERKSLEIDASNNYYPVHVVDCLFDTYEEAKEDAKQKNESMRRKISLVFSISDSSFKEKYDKAVEEFKKRLFNCGFYEMFITENTKDMKVTKEERLDTLRRLRRKTD